eukprot:TRINITY_DN31991_c0_g1_i2.p2 TRINITY_DN31991_c0_g1~~TRINITY_DN31991_c0_g1_i2.p2  ORF type:complete len:129 (+),score=25.16 TRINITY_DN31991_c0_g1_i2:38-424(+)
MYILFVFLMIRRPPRSTLSSSSAASDVYKRQAHYPILILNSGSWMRDPANEDRLVTDEEYQKHMAKALRIVKRQGFNGTLIWRTTYQGHPYCWRYTEPLTEELKEDDFPKVAPYLRCLLYTSPSPRDS